MEERNLGLEASILIASNRAEMGQLYLPTGPQGEDEGWWMVSESLERSLAYAPRLDLRHYYRPARRARDG